MALQLWPALNKVAYGGQRVPCCCGCRLALAFLSKPLLLAVVLAPHAGRLKLSATSWRLLVDYLDFLADVGSIRRHPWLGVPPAAAAKRPEVRWLRFTATCPPLAIPRVLQLVDPPGVTRLRLDFAKAEPWECRDILRCVCRLSGLENLKIDNMDLPGGTIIDLRRMSSVHRLRLHSMGGAPPAIEVLIPESPLSRLEVENLGGGSVVRLPAPLAGLRCLGVQEHECPAFAPLGWLSAVEELHVLCCIGCDGPHGQRFADLAALPALRTVYLLFNEDDYMQEWRESTAAAVFEPAVAAQRAEVEPRCINYDQKGFGVLGYYE